MRVVLSSAPLAVWLLVACEGAVQVGHGGGGGAVDLYAECASPSGYRVCTEEGDDRCPTSQCGGPCAAGLAFSHCLNDALRAWDEGYICPDGAVQADWTTGGTVVPVPFEVGLLYLEYGEADRVRYCDSSPFDGTPLLELDVCPIVEGFEACGGTCGGCPQNHECIGRSPTHLGICFELGGNSCWTDTLCGDGEECFWFSEEARHDPYGWGLCVATDTCAALEAQLPGGGVCVPTP